MSNQSESLYSNCLPPLFDCINEIMFSLFIGKFLRVVSDRRKPHSEGVKRMDLVMLFQMLESSDVCQGSPTKSVEHYEMWKMLFGMGVGVNFVKMVLFVNFNISGM